MAQKRKETATEKRARRVRFKMDANNKALRPRLSVHRTGRQIYAQVIDDVKGVTVAAASSLDGELKEKAKVGSTVATAEAVGKLVGERAKKAGIKTVMFDRGGYLFHGRVKALADGARAAGLEF
ncbi:MAG: 50S ribosomal protein L18 [Alphaproteobacteria bacterium]|nr:50S ribosomal protein L18 [Alphaproteobacteria bacterium]